jgi:aspartate/methionine/tyrosine aminotransferase
MVDIAPFYVMEIQRRAFELEAAGTSVMHCEIGQPDTGAPPSVVAAAADIMARDPLGYTSALGITPLREAIAGWYARRFGVTVDPAQVVVTAGASGAFLIATGTLVGPGDEILMPDPCYPCNRHFVRMFEGVARTIPVGPAERYQLSLALVERHWTPRTRGVLLASPSNPTGTTIAADELRAIADFVRARGGVLLVDEIYQGLTYGEADRTALALAPDAVVVNSFSKYFCMTGWRIGWIVAPVALVGAMERFAQNAFICPPVPSQHAALAALRPEAVAVFEERRAAFRARRDFLVPALERLGFRIPVMPDGAFYVYADASALTDDASAFAWRVLEEAAVAITPGRDFGSHGAGRHVRFAYTRAMDQIEEAVRRLERFLAAGGR